MLAPLGLPITTPAAALSIEELIKATEHPDWTVRWDAVNALGDSKDPRATPALARRALYDDNPHPRWRSLWALSAVEPSGAAAVPLLRAGLKESDPVVVRNAAVALAFFSQPDARHELLRGLSDPDGFRRWEAVFSLRQIGDAEVARALLSLLDYAREPDEQVRGEVALALGGIGGDGSVPALLKALRQDPSHQVRWRSAMGLARRGDTSVLADLKQALGAEQNQQVRDSIQEAIAQLERL